MKKNKKIINLKNIIIGYTKNNSKEYILVILIFVIGLFLGVFFVNNTSQANDTIITYITEFIEKFKNIEKIDKTSLLYTSVKNNIILVVILWLAGTTVIGLPIVLGLILFRGFCLGTTISAITFTLGTFNSIKFGILTLFLQNILFIPALLTMGVTSIKLYKSIIADRRKENIKIEVIRHTIISLIMMGVLIISSFIESEITVSLLQFGLKYMKI